MYGATKNINYNEIKENIPTVFEKETLGLLKQKENIKKSDKEQSFDHLQ